MSKKNVTAESLATAWARYHDLFGINPLGSLKQMAALLELIPAAAQPADGALRGELEKLIEGWELVIRAYTSPLYTIEKPMDPIQVLKDVVIDVERALAAQTPEGRE